MFSYNLLLPELRNFTTQSRLGTYHLVFNALLSAVQTAAFSLLGIFSLLTANKPKQLRSGTMSYKWNVSQVKHCKSDRVCPVLALHLPHLLTGSALC